MPSPAKQLTPAELSALEHAFAADPASDAYRPLTEAYLSMGRFMEAMVVCKKGVKAHPDDPAARALLARVYAEQGKDRKALEELSAVLAAYPTYAAALRMAGVLHLRVGERDLGEAALRRAAEAAPDDPEIRALVAKHGLAASAKPAAAGPRTGPDAPPVAPRVAPAAPAGRTQAGPASGRGAAPATAAPGAPVEEDVPVPTPAPVPAKRTQNAAYAQELAERYATQEFTLSHGKPRARGRKGTLATTVALFAVLAVALGGWVLFNRARKERIEAIDRVLKDTLPLLEKDAYAAYVEAGKNLERILELDARSIAGHAFLAYVDAIRAGEHGEEALKADAVKHVDAARQLGQRHSHLVAAEAYLKLHGGDPAGAKAAVTAVLEGGEGVQSALLQGVLGAIHLREGDLDAARDVLGSAQKATPGDVRIAYLLAEQFRRRGEGYELQAVQFYDYVLRLQKDHLWSVLGKAEVLVERGQLDEAGKAAQLVLAAGPAASRPQQALAHAIRGAVLAGQGKAAEAAAAESEAAKLDPASPEIPRLVGIRKLREGDAAGAVEALGRAVSQDPRRVSLYADLVRAQLAREGGAQQALETLKRAVARVGDSSPRIALLLGDAYRAAGDEDLARGQYEKAIQLGKPFPDARVALARLHRTKNNIPGALVELTQAIDEYGQGGAGGAAAAYVEMAEAERARGAKRETVAALYEKALERDAASCDALWGAGKLEADDGKLGETARQRLGTYAKLCPRSPHAQEAARLAGQR